MLCNGHEPHGLEGGDGKSELTAGVRQQERLAGLGRPAVYHRMPHLHGIDTHKGVGLGLYVLWVYIALVGPIVELLLCVMQCRGREGSVCLNRHAAEAHVSQLQPTQIGTGTPPLYPLPCTLSPVPSRPLYPRPIYIKEKGQHPY